MNENLIRYEEWDIPKSPGIYSFRLEALTLYELGIRPDSDFSSEDFMIKVRGKILDRIVKVETIMFSEELSGSVRNKDKSFTFNQFSEVKVIKRKYIVNSLNDKLQKINNIKSFTQILSTLNNLLPPLYVGITYEQTLLERYTQHKRSLGSLKSSSLGERLGHLNIGWSEIGFYAKPISISNIDKSELELSEDIFQYLSNPILSLR